jgi:hypothetical protein
MRGVALRWLGVPGVRKGRLRAPNSSSPKHGGRTPASRVFDFGEARLTPVWMKSREYTALAQHPGYKISVGWIQTVLSIT